MRSKTAKLIVVDPRSHRLVDFADIHVPIRVGSDIAFLNGLMHVLIQNLYDKTFVQTCTVGFNELKSDGISAWRPAVSIDQGSRTVASVKPMMLCYTLGITIPVARTMFFRWRTFSF
jgi:formate dehydrogenase major subunit